MQFATVSRGVAERVFIVAFNDAGVELEPYTVVQWVLNSTASEQGYNVEKITVDSLIAASATQGITNSPAGVVTSTMANQSVGRLQVYGPTTVAVSTTIAAGRHVVASSIGVAPTSGGALSVRSSDTGADYGGAIMGISIQSLSTTQSIVHLHNML